MCLTPNLVGCAQCLHKSDFRSSTIGTIVKANIVKERDVCVKSTTYQLFQAPAQRQTSSIVIQSFSVGSQTEIGDCLEKGG